MLYLLDTNVISEVVRPQPNPGVVEWLTARSPLDLAISVLNLGEIAKGVARMPAGARRKRIDEWLANDLPARFAGRILEVDSGVALSWGRLAADALSTGRPLSVVDGLLLATAQVHDLTLVTHDGACAGRGVPVLNPWK